MFIDIWEPNSCTVEKVVIVWLPSYHNTLVDLMFVSTVNKPNLSLLPCLEVAITFFWTHETNAQSPLLVPLCFTKTGWTGNIQNGFNNLLFRLKIRRLERSVLYFCSKGKQFCPHPSFCPYFYPSCKDSRQHEKIPNDDDMLHIFPYFYFLQYFRLWATCSVIYHPQFVTFCRDILVTAQFWIFKVREKERQREREIV